MSIGYVQSSTVSANMTFGQKVRSTAGKNQNATLAEKAGLAGQNGKVLGTPVSFKDILVRDVNTKYLKDKADEALTATQTDFMDRFVKAFDPEGAWLEQSISSDRLNDFASKLEDRLRVQDFKGAREEMKDFLTELSGMASKKILTIGRRAGGTLSKQLTEAFGQLAFSEGSSSGSGGGGAENTVATTSGAGASGAGQDPPGEYTSIITNDGTRAISGYKSDEGMTVMAARSPDRLADNETPDFADELIGGVIDKARQAYDDRLEAMYGKDSGAPGMQQAIDAVLDKMDSLFRNAYQNNYSEDAEGILQKGAEMFAGALFGQMGLNHISDRISGAEGEAYKEMQQRGIGASSAEQQNIFDAKYSELTEDIPEFSRLFTDAAESGVGSTDALFQGLEDMFMDELLKELDGRTLAKVTVMYLEGRHYSNEELEILKNQGTSVEKTV